MIKFRGENKKMKGAFTIFIGFIHDFAAGCWGATVLTVYWLDRLSLKNPTLQSILSPIKKDFFYIGLVCVAMVLVAGAGRTFTYVENVYGEDAEKKRRKMLIIKHILLLVVFGSGTYWQYTMAF